MEVCLANFNYTYLNLTYLIRIIFLELPSSKIFIKNIFHQKLVGKNM